MTTSRHIILSQNGCAKVLKDWTEQQGIELVSPESKQELIDQTQGLVVLHENHTFSKEMQETMDLFEKNHKPIHKVDINGTLSAISGNLLMWLDLNKVKTLALIGGEELEKNENLQRFLEKVS
jgi:hypothetical protein